MALTVSSALLRPRINADLRDPPPGSRPSPCDKAPGAASPTNRRSCRPSVLAKMPQSCNVVFDVLRLISSEEAVSLSIRELASFCRLSYGATWRALRRLAGARLVRWKTFGCGAGHTSYFEVLWDLEEKLTTPATSSFPQKNDPPYARGFITPGGSRISHTDGACRPKDVSRTSSFGMARAHRWACAQIRSEVRTWPLPWDRRNWVIDGVARAVGEVLEKGRVRPGPTLGILVRGVLFHLRQAEEISGNARSAAAFGRWAVRAALREMPRLRSVPAAMNSASSVRRSASSNGVATQGER